MVASAIIGSAVIGAGTSLLGSSESSSASKSAANTQLSMYNQTRSDLAPYNTIGQTAATNALNLATGSPTGGGPDYVSQAASNVPGTMTQAQLEQTPGYQWQMSQGLKAVQSAAASRGLGVSGASIKGGATYATNLADSNYETQFNNQQSRFGDYLNLNTGQQTNLSNQFQRLNSLSSLGESAASQTGQYGTSAASTAGNYINQSGLATAAGTTGVGSAATSAANNYTSYNALQSYLNPTSSGYTSAQNALNAGGSPSAFQAAFGTSSDQYVP
jgi:hypothetical protein